MNILIYSSCELYPTIGGIERISNNLAQALMEQGHQVYFLIQKRRFHGYNDTPVCEMTSLETNDFNSSAMIQVMADYFATRKIDIILNQDYFHGEFSLCIKRNFDIPLVSVIHNSPDRFLQDVSTSWNSFSPLLSKRKAKEMAKIILSGYRGRTAKKRACALYAGLHENSNRLVLLSDGFREGLRNFIPFDEKKVIAIPNFNIFEYDAPSSWLDEKEKIVLYVGRLAFGAKRVDRLIKIWENLYKKYPDWKLRIAGDGPEKANIERYIKRKGIKNVELLGFVQPEEEYKKASIFCMTSTFEGFPMVLIETSMYGCVPMAFFSFASIYDVIDNGVNGVLVEPFNLDEYQQNLEHLMTDDVYRTSLQKEALVINEKFRKEDVVHRWIELFEEVIEERNQK